MANGHVSSLSNLGNFSPTKTRHQKQEFDPSKSEISKEVRNLLFLGCLVVTVRRLTSISASLTEADLADFNLESLTAASEVLHLDIDNGQSGWFSRLHLEHCLRPRPLLVLAFVRKDGIPRLPPVSDFQVVPGHQAYCMPLVVRPVQMGHGVLAVEGYGLLGRT